MSTIVDKNNNKITIYIPNSEATVSAQLKCMKDREVTGYYTNDNEVEKNKIEIF